MYKVGIIGAGVGGSYLAYLLSKEGVDTVIFDFRVPREKLCGGGVTHKAMAKFPVLDELPCPRRKVWSSTIISPGDMAVKIDFEKPLAVFNRRDLDYSLLMKAQGHGADFRKEKVYSFSEEAGHWRLFTEAGDYSAEILVGADGAMSGTRKMLGLSPRQEDYFFALECFFDIQRDFITFKFFADFMGYLWVFPRIDSLCVGIVGKQYTRKHYHDMKGKLLHFIEHNFPGQANEVSLRGAYIPFFSGRDIQDPVICSRKWALIGDAAAFVDPLSGEGICYALYSADILAQCIMENELPLYQGLCMQHFGENLSEAADYFEYFYRKEFIETMVALAARCEPLKKIMSELVAGDLDYLTWKGSLKKDLFKIVGDFLFHVGVGTRREVMANLVAWYVQRLKYQSRHKTSWALGPQLNTRSRVERL